MNANPSMPAGRTGEYLTKGLFWAWNFIFLAFMLLGFAQLELPELIRGIRAGVTPPIYLVFSLVLIAIPVAAVLVGGLLLRNYPARLFALGYLVEWPLLLILLFRFFLIREGNPAITVLLVWLAVAEAAFLWHLLDHRLDQRHSFWLYLRLAGLTLLFSGTLYAAVWLLFYVPPIVVFIIQMVQETLRNFGEIIGRLQFHRWYELPLAVLGYILMFFSGTLIVVMPVAGPILAGRAWLHSLRGGLKARGLPLTLAAVVLPLALVLAVLGVSMVQPQQKAFDLLKTPPATPQQAQQLLERADQIRAGLVNAYLAPFRYMSSAGEVRHVSDLYRSTLNISQAAAWRFEQAYEVVIWPLLYDPVHPVAADLPDSQVFSNEPQEASVLYQRFFDQTIVQGERQEIVDAVRANPNGAQAELAWQAVDDREVHLNLQEINLSEHGDWAEVEIHEVYQNRTTQRQEVIYYFSLPESAVVTGLWLGNEPDREQAFAYQVAPRGAAQALYRNEIRYNRDPALVEQIGPRQYRLRAFPIEPQSWSNDSRERRPGPDLHVWMTYRTVALDGAWPMPRLAEKRNVYWDARTVRLVNGNRVLSGGDAWLPEALQASQPVVAAPHRVDFAGGQTVLVRPAADFKTPALPDNLRLAVVLDRSFSMRQWAGDVKTALASLKQIVRSGPEPDLFLTASKYRGEGSARVGLASLDPETVFYFGGQNAAELLTQFEELRGGEKYDAILVLTDHTGYELGQGDLQVQVPDAPVWVVHLGSGFPLGYDDPTQDAIQASGGGVAASVEEALARYAAGREAPGQVDLLDGYVWQTLPTYEVSSAAEDFPLGLDPAAGEPGFAALAARRVILSEMAKNHDRLDRLPTLDQLHKLAVEQGIVTPYSSMLVLVNKQQQRLLDQLSGRADRYQRELENTGDTTQANPFAVTGVPEPEEWLLIALAGMLLAYTAWRKLIVEKRQAPARVVDL